MLAPDDVVDLGEALRKAGFKVSTQQLFAVQQLLLRLAAEGALPATREPLARWIAPVLCTSAAEQAAFGARWRVWLHERFGEALPAPPPPPHAPAPAPRWPRVLGAGTLALAAALGLYLALRPVPPPAPSPAPAPTPAGPAASAPAPAPPPSPGVPASAAAGLVLEARFDIAGDQPAPTRFDRIDAPRALAAALPLAAWLVWLVLWLRRRPTLSRIASRTPPQLREVHVPGAVRALLPGLPLRRLAQELRRRRAVVSRELQVEPTIAATLARGGQFTPVRGSRVEPDYLALVDRAGLSDHQARLAGEVVAELARSDVLIDRFDFDRDAQLVRPRDALARSGTAHALHAVELAELHERCPEHRVLVFGDGSGCFDGFSGEPMAWTRTLAAWPMPVLLTPVPRERWGRREWALQRLGIQVLPLDADGLGVLMGVVAGLGAPAAAAEAPRGPAAASHERDAGRWLERDAPDEGDADALVADLKAELGPRGMAWLAACAAYPEVHWGITLRLGHALVTAPGEFERLLPRLARLVWFRQAYLPDWLRGRLLQELADDDEARARATLKAMLEAVARQGSEVPLRIALGAPDTGPSWWRRLFGDPIEALLRSAPPDSPLRDHVFLRFLSGAHQRRIDLRAPGTLLAALRSGRSARPLALGSAALAAALLVLVALTGDPRLAATITTRAPAFAPAGDRIAVTTEIAVGDWRGGMTHALTRGPGGWTPALLPFSTRPREMSARGDFFVHAERTGVATFDGTRSMALAGAAGPLEVVRIAPRTRHIAIADGNRIRLWRDASDRSPRVLDTGDPGSVWGLAFAPAEDRLASVTSSGQVLVWDVASGERTDLSPEPRASQRQVAFSPDGRRLATRGDSDIWIWELGGKAAPQRLPQGDVNVEWFVWSPDSRSILVWTFEQDARVWSVATGQAGPSLPGSKGGSGPDNEAMFAFSPDGTRIAGIDGEGSLRLWEAATGRVVGEPQSFCCGGRVAFSPDGTLLATADGSQVALWRVPAAAVTQPPPRALALLIGNDYRGTAMPLAAPVRDVRAVGAVLEQLFGFEVTRLEDGSRDAVLQALDRLAATAGEADRVVVMLSGRGTRDESGNQFQFYATPAGREFGPGDALTGGDLAARLAAVRARQLLVLGDTDFVHLLARERPAAVAAGPAAVRRLVAAYTNTNVFESAQGSAFALALEAVLAAAGPGLTDRTLAADLSRWMAASDRSKTGQRPSVHSLPGLGDRGGSFDFPPPRDAPSNRAAATAAAASGPAAGPLAGIRFTVARCEPGGATRADTVRVLAALGRLGATDITQSLQTRDQWLKLPSAGKSPVPPAWQVRVPSGFPALEKAAAQLLADRDFRALGPWQRVPVLQRGTGPITVAMCPERAADAAAPTASDAAGTPNATLRLELGREVQAQIGNFCSAAIGGRYPFSRGAASDVAMADFTALFGPGGRFDRFFAERLAPYVDTSRRPWRFKPVNGQVLGNDAGTLPQFERAQVIRDTYFRSGASTVPQVPFSVTPVELDPAIEEVRLEVGRQGLRYRTGSSARPVEFQWSGDADSAGARFSATPAKEAGGLRFEGPWAMQRLFDRAKVRPGSAPERLRMIFESEGRQALFELRFGSVRNPLRLPELTEFACPTGL